MAGSGNLQQSKAGRFSWQSHVGLIIGVATAIILSVKILAVANWDMNTAFGILAANGTANVLTGALLAVLPILAAVLAVVVVPLLERRLPRRTPFERAGTWLAPAFSGLLLLFIVPAYLLLLYYLWWAAIMAVRVVRSRRRGTKGRAAKGPRKGRSRLRRWDSTGIGLVMVFALGFGSLPTPWLPPEVVSLKGEDETAFVLNLDQDRATVLLDGDRSLAQVNADAVSGQYCVRFGLRLMSPFILILKGNRYPRCP